MIYKTFGTCSRAINFEVKDGIIESVEFVGGCRRQYAGTVQAFGRHERGRGHRQALRHRLQRQGHFLS